MKMFVSINFIFLLFACSNNQNIERELKPIPVLKSPKTIDSITKEFVEIDFKTLGIINKMTYATDSNFLHQKVYPCARAFLRVEPYIALIKANEIARKKGIKLVLFDAYRPISIQRKMYELVNNPDYVAHPDKGSKHNRGCAVDISLADINGALDMGTEFDDFSEKATYNSKSISTKSIANRKILRKIMINAGFVPYEKEWWHFNYKKTDYPISDFVWTCSE
jgi:zinc D-Ala-D-Ala dipeptidase